MQEYKKLEVLAFEMETAIASLEDQLAFANEGKDLATCRAESLSSDLEALSNELQMSNSELSTLKDEVSVLVSLIKYKSSILLGFLYSGDLAGFVFNLLKVISTMFRELVWKKLKFMPRKWKVLLNLCQRRRRSCQWYYIYY